MEEVTLDLLRTALNIAQVKQKVAANNIASYNVNGAEKLKVDFGQLITELKNTSNEEKHLLMNEIENRWSDYESEAIVKVKDEIKLDEENANVILAAGEYKMLVEGLNRKMALMKLAVSGGKR